MAPFTNELEDNFVITATPRHRAIMPTAIKMTTTKGWVMMIETIYQNKKHT